MTMTSEDENLDDTLDFEESMDELEELVAELEAGDLPLEESLSGFERGVKLAKICQAKLANAKQKVSVLVGDDMELIDFEDPVA